MSVETVRPAGAGHETLYVLLGSVLILALAATVVGLRQQSHEAQALDAHQVDARLDLNAPEQGIYADLQVAAEDIQARLDDGEAAPSVDELAAEGFPPFVADVAASSRGEHRWSYGETAGRPSYLGVSGKPEVAGSFLLLLGPVEVWLKPAAAAAGAVPGDARALADAGWRQVVSRFDAGVTRQHSH
ncbi:DUF6162 family protein [Pseudomonas aeruginosa]|uniref:DUF6162 family protein n=1 Tax=Pseudomonas aeruginosa TaxID=287 RepID=UPI000772B733|nr:DUF6162 family protein [Pseudomonas aeruginosa]KWX34731.1 hypothetical protein AW883_11765 [Pseudomonas aeruginosa]KWX36082.1 hypothetical protein AW882_11730 [Pseudomonas aeruginosa]KWX38960.1 hypothetical protein AW880_11970 [Pseudomonas aeruginosa]